MSRFTLSDMASLTGINTDTIRMWERRYNLLSPNRTLTNRKWYDDNDLKRILNISVLYQNGMRISKIAALDDKEIIEKASFLSERSQNPLDLTGSLILAMKNLDGNALNEIIIKSVRSRGLERTFTDVLFPFLHKIGKMWLSGSLDPSTEHFITARLRQRIISAIDSLSSGTKKNKKKILMFLPEGEYHELGLLFYSFIIQKRGHNVLYLGQSTPLDSVLSSMTLWKPDAVITGIHTQLHTHEPEEFLMILSSAPGRHMVYAGGILADYADIMNLNNIRALRTEEDIGFLI